MHEAYDDGRFAYERNIAIEAFEKMANYFMYVGFTYFDTSMEYHQGKERALLKKRVII